MRKLNVCVLFGGVSPEHEISLRSAQTVLNSLDPEKYNVFPVGITREGDWVLFKGNDYSQLPDETWRENPNNRRAAISPVHGQGLLSFEGDCVVREMIDVVFPVLHGANGEDGTIQGLLKIAGIPFVGADLAPSAIAMDKTLTKLVIDNAGIRQAHWQLVRNSELDHKMDAIVDQLETMFEYPMFVKPAGTGSSVGVSKAYDRQSLQDALLCAGAYDEKILVEEFIDGYEIEVAVMGNENPVASVCGQIDSGAEFYDYDAKYVTDTSVAYIPARIDEAVAEQVRQIAVDAYKAVGAQGMSRVDFFVTRKDSEVVFNEINTIPGFTSISMFPKLFEASGITYAQQVDRLLALAMEAWQ